MAKKAYLVTFTSTTRVVVDVPDNVDVDNLNLINSKDASVFYSIIQKARGNIVENAWDYLYGDNAEVVEDKECPYGEYEGD